MTASPKAASYKSEGLLLLAAMVWGLGFAAQKQGMEHIGPFAFNAARYLLAAVCLTPLLRRSRSLAPSLALGGRKEHFQGALFAGLALFAGSAFQQSGIVETSAGNAGFITGLYMVIVPFIAVLRGQAVGYAIWIGAALAVGGLYLLSMTEAAGMGRGDLLMLIGAFCWAAHVTVIGHYSRRLDPIQLAIGQCLVCSAFSFAGSIALEGADYSGVVPALPALLYAGCMSIGVGFTLQILGQQNAHPARAAIIMSLEAVFAVIAGWIALGETLTPRALAGCGLMMLGMILAQWRQG